MSCISGSKVTGRKGGNSNLEKYASMRPGDDYDCSWESGLCLILVRCKLQLLFDTFRVVPRNQAWAVGCRGKPEARLGTREGAGAEQEQAQEQEQEGGGADGGAIGYGSEAIPTPAVGLVDLTIPYLAPCILY